jgi:hypothetical protein
MTGLNLWHGGVLQPRDTNGLQPQLPPPVLGRGQLAFDPAAPLRDKAWQQLPHNAQEWLYRTAGPVVDWWASRPGHSRGVEAIVFGERAVSVAVAKQIPDARGNTVYSLRSRRLDATSWRYQQFELGSPTPVTRPTGPSAGAPSPLDLPFSAEWLGMLGFLPADAQRFMLHPFAGVGADDLVADGQFLQHSSMGWVELTMLLWAWDRRVVVLASAHLSGPIDSQAAWAVDHLICRHVQRPPSTTQL